MSKDNVSQSIPLDTFALIVSGLKCISGEKLNLLPSLVKDELSSRLIGELKEGTKVKYLQGKEYFFLEYVEEGDAASYNKGLPTSLWGGNYFVFELAYGEFVPLEETRSLHPQIVIAPEDLLDKITIVYESEKVDKYCGGPCSECGSTNVFSCKEGWECEECKAEGLN